MYHIIIYLIASSNFKFIDYLLILNSCFNFGLYLREILEAALPKKILDN